jgi:hypothetical protein
MTDPFKTQWSLDVTPDLKFKNSSMCAQIVLTVFDSRHSQRKQRLLTFLRPVNGSGLCNWDLFTVTYKMDFKKLYTLISGFKISRIRTVRAKYRISTWPVCVDKC